MLLAIIGVLRFWLPSVVVKIGELFRYVYSLSFEWNSSVVSEVMLNVFWQSFLVLGPIFLTAIAVGIAVNYIQVGSLLAVEPIKPQISRLNPLEGLKRMFGVRAWVQLIKSLFKVIIIGYFLYAVIRDNIDVFPALQGVNALQGAVLLGDILFELAWKVALAFVIVAIADYIYQWWEYEKNLRMSHEEIKEEFKQTEGDPQLKAQMKKRQKLIAMRRMMEDLKQADVVITNPIHFAVALKYDPQKFDAPYVVAKGQDEVALRMKEIARENDIVIMENKPLARSLYAQVEIGQVIPADLYKAVAEVLAFVYKINKRKRFYSVV